MNVMLYCNSKSIYYRIKKDIGHNEHIILISTNAKLLDELQQNVEGTILDSEHTFFSKETFEIIDTINYIIKKANYIYDSYIYEVESRIEGGLGGRIQDLLYLIEIFDRVIRNNRIRKIYCEKKAGALETEAILCVANYYGVSVQTYNNSSWKKRFFSISFLPVTILANMYCRLSIIKKICEIAKIKHKDNEVEYYDVGYVLWGGSRKHANWAIEKTSLYDTELKTGIFCYHTGEGICQLKKAGKNAKSVEAYRNWRLIFYSFIGYFFDKCRILNSTRKRLKTDRIRFLNIDVTASIFHLFQDYINRDKLRDVVYDNLVGEFIKYNRFRLLTGNGDTNFSSKKSFFFRTRKQGIPFMGFTDSTKLAGIVYPAGYSAQEPYPFMYSFGFWGREDTGLKQMLNNGWDGKYYFYPDTTLLKQYKRRETGKNLLLNNKKNRINKILWAPSDSTYGLYSVYNFIQDNKKVIIELSKLSIVLKVKYHISQNEEQIELIRDFCQKYCVEWIDKREAIEPYIEWADVIITTPSTVMLDAALQNKLVVCIVTDLSKKFLYQMQDYFCIGKRDDLDFEKIVNDADFRELWINKQNEYLKNNLQIENSKKIVEILKNYLDELDGVV